MTSRSEIGSQFAEWMVPASATARRGGPKSAWQLVSLRHIQVLDVAGAGLDELLAGRGHGRYEGVSC